MSILKRCIKKHYEKIIQINQRKPFEHIKNVKNIPEKVDKEKEKEKKPDFRIVGIIIRKRSQYSKGKQFIVE